MLAAVLGVFALPRAVAAQFSVGDLEMHLRLGRDAMTQVISVRSDSDSAQQVRILVKDWARDSIGQNYYDDVGKLPSSCAGRLTVFPLALQLAPRDTQFVRVVYEPAPDVDPGCWGIVLLEALRPRNAEARTEGSAVTLTLLTGVKVYVHREREQAAGGIEYADVEAFWERSRVRPGVEDSTFVRDVAVRFRNMGTAHLQVKSKVEIRGENTQLLHELSGPDGFLTPGAFRDFVVRVPNLPRGRYIAVTLIDFGDSEIHAAQVEFEIP